MPWTTPGTATAGNVLTASYWNTQVRDNMNSLVEAGTALPTSPVDGQSFYYVADATNGVVWHLRYRTAATGSYKWEFVGGPPLSARVLTSEVLAVGLVNAWGDAPTAGPSITMPALAGDFMIRWGAFLKNEAGLPADIAAGVRFGATNPTPNAAQPGTRWSAAQYMPAGNTPGVSVASEDVYTGLAASTVVKLVYIQNNNAQRVSNRWISIMPVRVG